jgi:hypothetical protein
VLFARLEASAELGRLSLVRTVVIGA